MKKAAPHIRIYSRRARFSRARQCDRRRRVAHLEGPPFPEPRNGIHRRPFRGEHGALDAVAAHGHRRARGWLPLRPSPPLRTADVPWTVHVSLVGSEQGRRWERRCPQSAFSGATRRAIFLMVALQGWNGAARWEDADSEIGAPRFFDASALSVRAIASAQFSCRADSR